MHIHGQVPAVRCHTGCIVKTKPKKNTAVRQPHGLAILSALLEAVRLQAATNLHLHQCQTLMRPFKRLAGHVHVSHNWGGRSSAWALFGSCHITVHPGFLGTFHNYVKLKPIKQAQSPNIGVWHVRHAGWALWQSKENKHCLELRPYKVELRSNVISVETKLCWNGLAVLCRLGRARITHPVCFWFVECELKSCLHINESVARWQIVSRVTFYAQH